MSVIESSNVVSSLVDSVSQWAVGINSAPVHTSEREKRQKTLDTHVEHLIQLPHRITLEGSAMIASVLPQLAAYSTIKSSSRISLISRVSAAMLASEVGRCSLSGDDMNQRCVWLGTASDIGTCLLVEHIKSLSELLAGGMLVRPTTIKEKSVMGIAMEIQCRAVAAAIIGDYLLVVAPVSSIGATRQQIEMLASLLGGAAISAAKHATEVQKYSKRTFSTTKSSQEALLDANSDLRFGLCTLVAAFAEVNRHLRERGTDASVEGFGQFASIVAQWAFEPSYKGRDTVIARCAVEVTARAASAGALEAIQVRLPSTFHELQKHMSKPDKQSAKAAWQGTAVHDESVRWWDEETAIACGKLLLVYMQKNHIDPSSENGGNNRNELAAMVGRGMRVLRDSSSDGQSIFNKCCCSLYLLLTHHEISVAITAIQYMVEDKEENGGICSLSCFATAMACSCDTAGLGDYTLGYKLVEVLCDAVTRSVKPTVQTNAAIYGEESEVSCLLRLFGCFLRRCSAALLQLKTTSAPLGDEALTTLVNRGVASCAQVLDSRPLGVCSSFSSEAQDAIQCWHRVTLVELVTKLVSQRIPPGKALMALRNLQTVFMHTQALVSQMDESAENANEEVSELVLEIVEDTKNTLACIRGHTIVKENVSRLVVVEEADRTLHDMAMSVSQYWMSSPHMEYIRSAVALSKLAKEIPS